MDIRQLRYFLAIVDNGGVKSAARVLGVRQPSLSQALGRLEDDLGETLFDRLGHGVALTSAGELLVPRARRLLADSVELRRAVREDLDGGKGTLAVGALPTIAPFLMPAVLRQFRDEFPDATVEFHEVPTSELVEMVARAEVEIGVVATSIDDDRVAMDVICREPLFLALPPDHDCSRRERLCADDLEEVGIIVLSEVHCLGDQAKTLCRLQGVDRSIRIEAGQLETALQLVKAGLGITVIPTMAIEIATQSGLVVRPLVDGAPARPIGLIRNGSRMLSQLARRFSEITTAHVLTMQQTTDLPS